MLYLRRKGFRICQHITVTHMIQIFPLAGRLIDLINVTENVVEENQLQNHLVVTVAHHLVKNVLLDGTIVEMVQENFEDMIDMTINFR